MDSNKTFSPDTVSTELAVATPPEEPMLYCPVCDNRLSEHRCKLLCRRCGYFMSCADFY
jgi:hypothetical protein